MERFNKSDYRGQYPNLGDEIIDYLQKSDRKIEYQQYDLKVDQYRIDSEKETVTYIPSREDSYDRLLEEGNHFQTVSESVEDIAVRNIAIQSMMNCVALVTMEEQDLIFELFFSGRTEREYAEKLGISQKAVNKRKQKVLRKLKKMMKI